MHVIFVTFGHAEGCLCNRVRAFICVFVFEVTTKSCGCISVFRINRLWSNRKQLHFEHATHGVALGANTLPPHVGSGVVRIDLLHFLVGCHKMRLNQVLSYILAS